MTVTTTSLPSRTAVPCGLTADNTAVYGLLGFVNNSNVAQSMVAIAYGSATSLTLTGAQFVSGIIDLSGSGVLALSMPSVANIIAALPPTIPQDGTFNFRIYILNDSTGQTTTVTGVTGVTVLGTATVATATVREFLVNVNPAAGTVTMLNLGSTSL